jgi:hypothetical protein
LYKKESPPFFGKGALLTLTIFPRADHQSSSFTTISIMDFIKNAVSGSGDKKATDSKGSGQSQDYGDKGKQARKLIRPWTSLSQGQ